jgi:hypothetical protein
MDRYGKLQFRIMICLYFASAKSWNFAIIADLSNLKIWYYLYIYIFIYLFLLIYSFIYLLICVLSIFFYSD